MGMFDALLGQLAGNLDIGSLAARVGLTPEQAEMAIHALGVAHPQPGDTVSTAAASTGLPQGTLQQILAHLGGENALGPIAGAVQQQGGGGMGGGGLGGLFGTS